MQPPPAAAHAPAGHHALSARLKLPPNPAAQAQGRAAYGRTLAGLPGKQVQGQNATVPKLAALSEAEEKRRRHQHYMRNRQHIQQHAAAYRAANRAKLNKRGKRYRRELRTGARRQRQRVSTGGHEWSYMGYKAAGGFQMPAGTVELLLDGAPLKEAGVPVVVPKRVMVKGLVTPRIATPRLGTGTPQAGIPQNPFRVNWKKPPTAQ